jgi:hypothetical protein
MRTTGYQDTVDRRKHTARAKYFSACKYSRFGRARSVIRDFAS